MRDPARIAAVTTFLEVLLNEKRLNSFMISVGHIT